MTINPFIAGVLFTAFIEMAAMLVAGIIATRKKK